MFRTAELGQKVSKSEYNERVPVLREQLLEAQGKLREANFPVLILFGGVDGAGKGDLSNLLSSWLDPRWIVTRAFGERSQEEAERPDFWRYWRDLPPRGRIGIFLSAWYSNPLVQRVYRKTSAAEFEDQIAKIVSFERMLANDGALILKFWMHLGRDAQKRRLKTLEKDPLTKWRVTDRDWQNWKMYDRFIESAEHILMRTSTGRAAWTIVEGADARYRSLRVGGIILDEVTRRLSSDSSNGNERSAPPSAEPLVGFATRLSGAKEELDRPPTVLNLLDMEKALPKKEYGQDLEKYQSRLNLLHRSAREQGVSTILVFEGWDAGGKGGAIRRLTAALDARSYQVTPIAAPTDEERAHHYLWRFWRHLSRAGRFTIFDRSWYGRVLVERVEGFATEAEWRRAYAEINDFEKQLVDHGIVLVKFWLHITREEQEARFKAREETPFKRWKLTEEDWRNREKWDQYEQAVHDMIERTSTQIAPWVLVEGNDKRFARIKVIKAVCKHLGDALKKSKKG